MKRILVGLLCVGIGLALLTACDSDTPNPVAADARGATAAASDEPVEATPEADASETAPLVEENASDDLLPADLASTDINAFLDAASSYLVTRSPETVTHLGISTALGMGDGDLAPLTLAYQSETQAMEAAVLSRLQDYDLSAVSPQARLNAQIYGSFLEDVVGGHRFADRGYLVYPGISSYPQYIERLLTATHPLRTERNALDYLSRLSQLDERYREVLDALDRSEAIGAVPPRFLVEHTYGILQGMASVEPTASPLYTSFADRLGAIAEIDAGRRAELLAEAERLIAEIVLPAYGRLVTYMGELSQRATYEEGVWKMEDGDAYYAYLLRHYTTTELTPDEIHAIGLAEVERIQGEIWEIVSSLGYDENLSLAEVFAQASQDSGLITGEAMLAECERLVEEAKERFDDVFHRYPEQELEVVAGDTGAFYSPGSLDGTRPGKFYAPIADERPLYRLPTLIHHEAIPGHHFQISFAHEVDIPGYRAGLSFTAYAEGWALYAERLAWELGAYDEDPYGNLGRLQDELFRAARLVVDTGIHAKRWGFQQAADYMAEATGLDMGFVQHQISRYILIPGQATSYKIGMLRFVELRKRAEEALGDAFDLADFHDAVLREGSVPLTVLEELIESYIEAELVRSGS